MKKLIFKFAFFLSPLVYSQTDGLNFQSIMFDSNGVKEVNASMLIRFTINNQSGSSLYSETQSVTTDSNGLISVIIGTGTGISSSSFSTLNWKDAHSITVARNHNGVYSNIGTSDFTYVPYSKIAQSVYTSGIEINSGIVSATTFVGDGSGLTNLPTSTLTSIDQLSDARLIQESSQDGASLFIGNSDNSYSASYTGDYNTGFGHNALVSLQSGSDNDAFGDGALQYNTIGSGNAAFGSGALMANSTGSLNVAIGGGALEMSTTGSGNVAIGRAANETNRTGDKNITIGWHSDVASSGLVNAIAIGSEAIVNQSNSIQLGNHEITLVQTAGTVSATAFRGDGSQLTGINVGHISGLEVNMASNTLSLGVSATAFYNNSAAIGNFSYASQPDMIALGNPSTQLVETWGTVSATAFRGDGSQLTGINVGQIPGIEVNMASNTLSLGASATAFYNNSAAIGNFSYASQPDMIALGNPSTQLVETWGTVSATAFRGDGSQLTGINVGQIPGIEVNMASNTLSLGASATAFYNNSAAIGNFSYASQPDMIALGNPSTQLVETWGTVSATAFRGDGSQLTGINVGQIPGIEVNMASNTLSLGASATAFYNNSAAIGNFSYASQPDMIALGNPSTQLVETWGTVSATAFRGDGSELSNIQMSQIEGILIDNQSNKLGIATNYVYGSNSVAIGAYAGATASNTVAIGYGAWTSMPNTVSIGNSQHESFAFGIAGVAPGRALQVGTTTSAGNGAYLTTGGVWTDASSIKLKTNFLRLDDNWLFSKIKNLDILRWEYKNSKETHIGPTSEQFVNEFSVGNGDDKHLSTLDVSGVALRGVQALIHKIEEKESEITELKNEVNRLSKLEILVKELESHISKLEELFIDSNND